MACEFTSSGCYGENIFLDIRLGWLVSGTQHCCFYIHLQAAAYRWWWLHTDSGLSDWLCFLNNRLIRAFTQKPSGLLSGTYSNSLKCCLPIEVLYQLHRNMPFPRAFLARSVDIGTIALWCVITSSVSRLNITKTILNQLLWVLSKRVLGYYFYSLSKYSYPH